MLFGIGRLESLGIITALFPLFGVQVNHSNSGDLFKFWQIIDNISEMVQDFNGNYALVTMENYLKEIMYGLPIATDLKWVGRSLLLLQ